MNETLNCTIETINNIRDCVITAGNKAWPSNGQSFLMLILFIGVIWLIIREIRNQKIKI